MGCVKGCSANAPLSGRSLQARILRTQVGRKMRFRGQPAYVHALASLTKGRWIATQSGRSCPGRPIHDSCRKTLEYRHSWLDSEQKLKTMLP